VRQSFAFVSKDFALLTSKIIGPALTFINKTVEPLLDLVLAKYRDEAFLESIRARNREATATGTIVNLDDMEFLKMLARNGGGALATYPNHLTIGHIDHCIFAHDDGLVSLPDRRHISRKRVFWEDDGSVFRPSFRRQSDNDVVPALMIHFQNGAKRKMRRFNRVARESRVPRPVRLRYYNFLLG